MRKVRRSHNEGSFKDYLAPVTEHRKAPNLKDIALCKGDK